MPNTPLTRARQITAIIAGTPVSYIDRRYLKTWHAIVSVHHSGQCLSEAQFKFLQTTSSYASTRRDRHHNATRRCNHALRALPLVFRG
jgi:hypothetical protein